MVENILGNNIYGATINRLDINFNVREKSLDSFIGRTAHINYLTDTNFIGLLVLGCRKLLA